MIEKQLGSRMRWLEWRNVAKSSRDGRSARPFKWTSLLLAVLAFTLGSPGILTAQAPAGFYRTDGQDILGPDGNPGVVKGVGLGGWLMPEGYMLHISAPDGGSPRTIRSQIEQLIGVPDTDHFFELFRANYVEEKDIAQIAAWGFDHIRLPFHYNILYDPNTLTFKEEGFDLLDTFLEWCRTYELGVILDMHATPGAQNSLNISDSDGIARLWTQPVPYQDRTVAIWIEIARRYKDEPLIIGYDLINEPVTPDGYSGVDLRNLYVRLTQAIRNVDTNHILFIEGNYFATDFPNLVPPFDDNMVYAFHKYWNATDVGTIRYLLDIRRLNNRPLWLGETGENSNPWFYSVRKLMENNEIGWNWWTHKKIETTTSPLSAPYAPGYEAVLEYWRGNGARPSPDAARDALFAMAEGLDMDSCEVRPGVIASLFDDSFNLTRRPFANQVVPGVIHAADYDIGNQGIAYSDTDVMASSGSPGGGNTGGSYRNDGVDIQRSSDPYGFDYNVGWMEAGEWLKYTVDIDTDGLYDIELRVASGSGNGRLRLLLDGSQIGTDVEIINSGGWQNWISAWLRDVELPEGRHTLEIRVEAAGVNLNSLFFTLEEDYSPDVPPDDPFGAKFIDHFPNPAQHHVTVRFETDTSVTVGLRLHDALGREVYHAVHGQEVVGRSAVPFDLNVPSGFYLLEVILDSSLGRRILREQLVVVR